MKSAKPTARAKTTARAKPIAVVKTIIRAKDTNDPDCELIATCIAAGEAIAAHLAVYNHYPDDDSKYAEQVSGPIVSRLDNAISAIIKLEAHTGAGLNAKARLAVALIEYEWQNAPRFLPLAP